jgi:hypothetical protein
MKRGRIRFDKETLEDLYLKKHMTGQEIADIAGVTRQGIYKAMDRLGIDRSAAERFTCICDMCGTAYELYRQRWNATSGHYCSTECYHMHRGIILPHRRENRQQKRIARAVMAKHLGRALVKDEVVHHIDGDEYNNSIDNLVHFVNHSEHLRYHHQLRINRIKEGKNADIQGCRTSPDAF